MEDFEYKGKRHFAVWQGRTPVVLIGYSRRQNNILAVSIDNLPEEERNELINIALNENLQTKMELASTLQNTAHTKSGDTWMANIAMRMRRGDNSVITAYVKNLEFVEDEQMAYYKGWGPKAKLQISEAEKAAILGPDYRTTTSASVNPTVGSPTANAPTAESTQTVQVLSQLASLMSRMSDQLDRIDEKVSTSTAKKPAKKAKESTATSVVSSDSESLES